MVCVECSKILFPHLSRFQSTHILSNAQIHTERQLVRHKEEMDEDLNTLWRSRFDIHIHCFSFTFDYQIPKKKIKLHLPCYDNRIIGFTSTCCLCLMCWLKGMNKLFSWSQIDDQRPIVSMTATKMKHKNTYKFCRQQQLISWTCLCIFFICFCFFRFAVYHVSSSYWKCNECLSWFRFYYFLIFFIFISTLRLSHFFFCSFIDRLHSRSTFTLFFSLSLHSVWLTICPLEIILFRNVCYVWYMSVNSFSWKKTKQQMDTEFKIYQKQQNWRKICTIETKFPRLIICILSQFPLTMWCHVQHILF